MILKRISNSNMGFNLRLRSEVKSMFQNEINRIDSQLSDFQRWTDENWLTLPDSIKSVLISGKIRMEEMKLRYEEAMQQI